jgi:hypothetical protein
VLQIVYVQNLIYEGTEPGHNTYDVSAYTVNSPGNAQASVTTTYRLSAQEAAKQWTMSLLGSHGGGVGPDNWSILVDNYSGDGQIRAVAYASAVSHEVGHILGLRHRVDGGTDLPDGLPDRVKWANLMSLPYDVPSAYLNNDDFDLIQAMAVETARVFVA